MGHDLKEFIETNDTVPASLYATTLELAKLSLNPKNLLFKFYMLSFLGAIITLAVCPQYGFGPFGGEFGIVHKIMAMGPVICGLFCSSVFFAGGYILSFLFLNPTEKKWIFRNEYFVIIPYVSIMFMLGMTMRILIPGHIHHDVFLFYSSWLGGGLLFSIFFYGMLKRIPKLISTGRI